MWMCIGVVGINAYPIIPNKPMEVDVAVCGFGLEIRRYEGAELGVRLR